MGSWIDEIVEFSLVTRGTAFAKGVPMASTARRVLALALPIAALFSAPGAAFADDVVDDEQMPPPPPPPPVLRPVYQAPLSQETQSTYVPQSVALSGPEEIKDHDSSRPAPEGYTPVMRTRKGFLIGGAVTFGVSYGISVMTAAVGEDVSTDGENEVAALWIPVAGPFWQMARTESATAKVFLFGLGAAQVTGAVLLYKGLTSKKRVFVRNDLVGSMNITPMAGDGTTGAMLSGRF
jgi:hypothetical protein